MVDRKRNNNKANNGGKWLRPEKRQALYERDRFACVYCGRSIFEVDSLQLTIDHVQPQELGGTNEAKNLVTACKACNSAKGAKTLRGFIKFLDAKGVDITNVAKNVRNAQNRRLNYGKGRK